MVTVLSATARADLASLPIEVEGGAPVATCVIAAPGGWQVAWAFDGGRRKVGFGPVYPNPIEASAASQFLKERTYGPAS